MQKKKVTVKIPAKLNLTLDILGLKDGYHDINSLVASVNIFDTITCTARTDGKINLTMKGLPVDCPIIDNNAYKAAKLFIETFSTPGVDIVIDKRIPVAGGLGGSSADIAGVLKAMNILYDIKGDMTVLASDLGSDSAYMLTGGYAVIKGRGEIVEPTKADRKIYLLIITENASISARGCYKKFDELNEKTSLATEKAKKAIYKGDLEGLFALMKNDLEKPAVSIVPQISHNLYALKKAGAVKAMVAGSGPSVFGVFYDKLSMENAFKALSTLYKGQLIKTETIVPQE